MFNTQHEEYVDPNSVVRGETGESKLAVLGVVQRGNPLDKTEKELSWQGKEHSKLEMRELGIETVIVITIRSHYTVY